MDGPEPFVRKWAAFLEKETTSEIKAKPLADGGAVKSVSAGEATVKISL